MHKKPQSIRSKKIFWLKRLLDISLFKRVTVQSYKLPCFDKQTWCSNFVGRVNQILPNIMEITCRWDIKRERCGMMHPKNL